MTAVDYAFSPHPPVAALKAADIKHVGRYISTDPANDANGKNLTPGENEQLRAAGIGLILFAEEDSATDILGGHDTGVVRAQHFDAVVKALHMSDAVMVCCADFDATPAQQTAINGYLIGAASVLGKDRIGLYGGFYPVHRALNAGVVNRAVQTFAWSGYSVSDTVPAQTSFTDLLGNPFTLYSAHDQGFGPPTGILVEPMDASASSLPNHTVVVTSVAGRSLPGKFLFDERAGLRQGLQGSVGGSFVDFDQTVLEDFCQWPRPSAPAPKGQHVTDGKTTLGEYAASRNYVNAIAWLGEQDNLNAADAAKLANAAVPPAGLTWHTAS